MKNILIVLCIFLASCSTKTIQMIDKPELDLTSHDALKLKDVNFLILHEQNFQEKFKLLHDKNLEPVLFCLSGTDYKNVALNLNDIINYILYQQKMIESYVNYYEGK